MWVNIPLLAKEHSLLETEVKIKLRVGKAYGKGYSNAFWHDGLNNFSSDTTAAPQNNNFPMYEFDARSFGRLRLHRPL